MVVYNRKEVTLHCLQQLAQQTYQQFSVTVVDDGSTDGTADAVRECFPSTNLIVGPGNWWWTKSVNKGIMWELIQGTSHILLLNDDTHFDHNYLSVVISEIKLHNRAIIGSVNLSYETPHRVFFSGAKSLNRILFRYTRYHKTFSLYKEVKRGKILPSVYLPARGALVPASVFSEIGLLDEKRFPQYASDVDFTLKAYKKGIRMHVSERMILYTPSNSTGSGDIYKKESLLTFLSSFSNRYAKRHLYTNLVLIKNHVPLFFLPVAFISNTCTILVKYLLHKIVH